MQDHHGLLPPRIGSRRIRLPQIDAVPPAIQGDHGRDRTRDVANLCAATAPSFEEFEAWMHAWNRTCEPPWDGDGYEGIEYWIKDAWAFVRSDRVQSEQVEILRVAAKKRSFPGTRQDCLHGTRAIRSIFG